MRALLIGGTGFIGPFVVRQLLERGHEITVFHRGQHEATLPAGVRHIRSEQAAMPVCGFPAELLRLDFDLLIHMIAMGEADAQAAVQAFAGRVGRMVVLSSGDVYRAYGRFTGLEPGPIEPGLLQEDSPLRTTLYPYRAQATSPDELNFLYEKILVERAFLESRNPSATVLRLPKVYGEGGNADLASVYGFSDHPDWRWTHGYVENVAAAIILAGLHPSAVGRVYNVGEELTPTVAERLQGLPPATLPIVKTAGYDFRQDLAYDTRRIREELNYVELVSYDEGLRRTLKSAGQSS